MIESNISCCTISCQIVPPDEECPKLKRRKRASEADEKSNRSFTDSVKARNRVKCSELKDNFKSSENLRNENTYNPGSTSFSDSEESQTDKRNLTSISQ